MGKFDQFKVWLECKRTGRMKEYESYKKSLESNQYDINRFRKYIEDATRYFEDVKQKFPEGSKEYIEARDKIYRWKHSLDEALLARRFIRPNSDEDIEYRRVQCETFESKLQSVLSTNLDLRFHGTPIYFAEQIIRQGSISSTADRYDGYIKSTDMIGEISASNRNSIGRTINFFSDMGSYYRSLPAGCIFAVFPKDKEDAEYGQDLLHSVDFKTNPSRLFGIFTTPENIENVKSWMKEVGFNPDIVYTFEQFLQVVKIQSKSIDEQVKFDSTVGVDSTVLGEIQRLESEPVKSEPPENLGNLGKEEEYK